MSCVTTVARFMGVAYMFYSNVAGVPSGTGVLALAHVVDI